MRVAPDAPLARHRALDFGDRLPRLAQRQRLMSDGRRRRIASPKPQLEPARAELLYCLGRRGNDGRMARPRARERGMDDEPLRVRQHVRCNDVRVAESRAANR